MDPLKKLSQVRNLQQKDKDVELIKYLYQNYDNDKPSKFLKKYKKIMKEISIGGCQMYKSRKSCNCSKPQMEYPECTNYFNIEVFNYAISLPMSAPTPSGTWSYMGGKRYESHLEEIYNAEYGTTNYMETLTDKAGHGIDISLDKEYINGKAYYYNNVIDTNDTMKQIIINNLNNMTRSELLNIVKIVTHNDPQIYNALIS